MPAPDEAFSGPLPSAVLAAGPSAGTQPSFAMISTRPAASEGVSDPSGFAGGLALGFIRAMIHLSAVISP